MESSPQNCSQTRLYMAALVAMLKRSVVSEPAPAQSSVAATESSMGVGRSMVPTTSLRSPAQKRRAL